MPVAAGMLTLLEETRVENLETQALPSGFRPRIIVKVRDDARLDLDDRPLVGAAAGGARQTPWRELQREVPDLRVTRVFGEFSAGTRADLRRRTAAATGAPAPDLDSFVALSFPPGTSTERLEAAARDANGWSEVETAYVEALPAPPPIDASDDPRFPNQGYLDGAPDGIDVEAAWAFSGGDGSGVGFVDLEQGWTLGHEDVAGAGVTIISGVSNAYVGHGTAVLGVVLGQDNTKGGIGIAPACSGRVVSEWRDASTFSTPAAIISAALAMSPGDVLLLEAQRNIGGNYMPVEVELATYVAILVATALGIVVVEAAGNGSTDLDNYVDPVNGSIFKRGHADFRDSGAIVVGACNSAAPHARSPWSNFGSRIDCYAWGQNIDTADGSGGNTTSYRNNFSGTSGASAIIAGVAVSVQGLASTGNGRRLDPMAMRSILADGNNGTESANPGADKIGVMPSLRSIVYGVIFPVGDFPEPRADVRYAGRPIVVIDPGHGGHEHAGHSSPYGVRGPSGLHEKDVNLQLGRRVAERLGGHVPVRMTRSSDVNLSLGERIEAARSQDAAVFLSIHADSRDYVGSGPEVWVHGTGGVSSRVLGQSMRDALGEGRRARLQAGPMAVLDPVSHGTGTAACLVEVDDLGHEGGERRLQDPTVVDRLADAMASGVLTYLGVDAGHRRYGRRAFAAEVGDEEEPQACHHEDTEPERPPSSHAHAMSTPPELVDLLSYLGISYSTFAAHESDYFLTLTGLLINAGTIHAPTLLNRSTFAAAVEDFQRSAGLSVDGLPGQDTLWELQHDWALGRNIGTTRVTADQVSGSGGYNRFTLRDDIVERYNAMRDAVVSQGGVITSAGSMRSLSATVTQGRSSKSMHYSGLAIDLATDTGMRSTDQRYIITQDGSKWRVWCKSDSAPSQTLDAVIWSGGSTSTRSVTVNAFDFTTCAERYGFRRIGPRSSFPGDYMSAEWWHFQCEAALTPWISQFGIELLSLSRYSETDLQRHSGIWGNRKKLFKKDWW